MLAGGSEVLGYAAEALLLAGELEAAQRQVAEALHVASTLEEHVYLPQLFQIEGAIARRRGDRPSASASIRRAVAEAQTQGAPWLEVIALIDLAEHGEATAKDRRALAALVDKLPEAAETAVVARARSLLDKTRAA
jgi:hypothetical protein